MEFKASIPDPTTSRTLDIHYKFWTSIITVCAPGSETPLYALNATSGGRNVSITKDMKEEIGSAKIHSTTSKIEVDCKSGKGLAGSFEIRNDGLVFGSPCYTSPAFDGQKMTWRNKAMSSKIIYTLIDGSAMALARFESSPKTKIGSLEILNPDMDEDKMNELIVTILALLHRKLQMINTSYLTAVT